MNLSNVVHESLSSHPSAFSGHCKEFSERLGASMKKLNELSDKTPPSYASVVAKCCANLHCRRLFSLYCRAKKIHDSRLMTEVLCNNFLTLFESYGRRLHGASIQSGPPSALAIAVADTFRIPFGIATSAAFSPFYNFSSPYYGDEVWCSFHVSPLCGPVQGGVLWVDTHHAWMFNACQRIMDAVLGNDALSVLLF